MLGAAVPERLMAVLPGVDWNNAKRLPWVEARIAELEKERGEITGRLQRI